MADTTGTFDWREHVTIGDGFTPPQRAAIVQSLDDISHFADKDGQKLIAQAQKVGGGRMIEILPAQVETDSNQHFNADGSVTPQVRISFDAQSTLGVQTADGVKPMSLTATIVHEFDHLATPVAPMDAQAERTLLDQLQLSPTDPKSQAMLQHLRTSAAGDEMRVSTAITDIMLHPRNYGDWLSKTGFPEAGARLAETNAAENAAALQRDGILSKQQPSAGVARIGSGIPQNEEDAAGFTHAIIEKNYGPGVATPVHYLDAVSVPTPQPVTALPEPTHIYPTKGFEPTQYTAGDLGTMAAPAVPARTNGGPAQGQSR